MKENNLAFKVINKMQVVCLNMNKGCEWEGKLEQFREHLRNECVYEESVCGHQGCLEKVVKK